VKIADLFVDLKLDTGSFSRELNTALRRASAQSVTVDVDVNTRAANASLDHAARDRTANVRVDVQGQKGINFAFKGVSNLTTAIAGLGGTALPILSAVGAGAGVMGSALLSAGAAGGIFTAAVQGQIKAMKDAQKNLKTQRDGLAKLAPGTKEYAEKLKQVNSLQREFNQNFGPAAKGFDNLKDSWSKFLGATSKTTLPAIGGGLQLVSDLLPRLVPIANAAGRAVNGLITELGQFTKTNQFQSILDFFQRAGPGAITSFGHIAGNIILGVINVFRSFAPEQQSLLNWIEGLTAKFRAWSASIGGSNGFTQWMNSVKQNLPAIQKLIVDITQVIAKFVQGLGPLAALQFKGMTILADQMNRLPPGAFTAIATGGRSIVVALKLWEIGSKAFAVAEGIAKAATFSVHRCHQQGRPVYGT
jgi:hypothetical protein